MSIRERFEEYWPHDDSPGFSDYPEIDIKAHRSNARTLRILGLGLFGAGGIATAETGGSEYLFAGLAAAALTLFAASQLRLQALEWEIQMLKGSADGDPNDD